MELAKEPRKGNFSGIILWQQIEAVQVYTLKVFKKCIVYHQTASAASNKKKATLISTYFQLAFSFISSVLPSLQEIIPQTEVLSEVTFSEQDVLDTFINLTADKAMGIDHICPKVLKLCALSFYLPFH